MALESASVSFSKGWKIFDEGHGLDFFLFPYLHGLGRYFLAGLEFWISGEAWASVISRENADGGEVEYESLIGQQMVIEMWREKL